MKNSIKPILSILSAICLVCTMMIGCTSPVADTSTSTTTQPTESSTTQPSTDGTLDWNMQASYVTSDGTVLDTMAITVSGSIEMGQGAHDILSLYIHLSETFRFLIPTHEVTQFFSPTNKPEYITYFEGNAYCLDRNTGDFAQVKLALIEDQKALILHFSEDRDKYLVASADETVTPQQILSYFEYFVQTVGTLDWNMEGYHVTQDGTVTNPVAFTMSGEIVNNNNGVTALTLEIDLPPSFPYAIQVNEFFCHSKDLESFQYYVVTNFCLDKNAKEDEKVFIALDVNKGYAAFVWPDHSVLYASASKDADLDSIMQHFQKFLQTVGTE